MDKGYTVPYAIPNISSRRIIHPVLNIFLYIPNAQCRREWPSANEVITKRVMDSAYTDMFMKLCALTRTRRTRANHADVGSEFLTTPK